MVRDLCFRFHRIPPLRGDGGPVVVRYAHGYLRNGARVLASVQGIESTKDGSAESNKSREIMKIKKNTHMENNVYSLKKTARLAGLLYLILVITGIYGIMYVPSQIIVKGDAATVANNILSNEFLFRTGIISGLISNIIFVFLVLALYRLLKQVNEHTAKLMVALVIVQIPAVFIMEAFNITSLMIFKGEIFKTFELSQRHDLAMLFLRINDYGMLTLEMFWGLWLLPLGLLVYKSGFIPRIFGILLIIAGIAYMNDSLVSLLFPSYSAFVNQPTLLLVAIGEISITPWLLIKGVKNSISTIEKQ